MTRVQYRQELERLKNDVLEMGELSNISIINCIAALEKQDVKIAAQVFEDGKRVDELEFAIEKDCMRLLALQQPMASDLRFIVTCLKIIGELDRISDHSQDIANIAIELAGQVYFKPHIDIPRMREACQDILKIGLEAFKTGDISHLMELQEKEDLVDALYDQIRREAITFMIEDPKLMRIASHFSFIAQHLERIADHGCNIGSRVYYMITGDRIKIE
ncbi:MAG: phosphate signaling complex protein PhoU [Methanocellales archaeon]